MKLNELIVSLQKISAQRGNPEICFEDTNNWRAHQINRVFVDCGLVQGVIGDYNNFIPLEVIRDPRGYEPAYSAELKTRPTKELLLLSLHVSRNSE